MDRKASQPSKIPTSCGRKDKNEGKKKNGLKQSDVNAPDLHASSMARAPSQRKEPQKPGSFATHLVSFKSFHSIGWV
jgi:hypothetical protein